MKQQSLARVAHIMSTLGQSNETDSSKEKKDSSDFDGDEIDDDLVFSTVPQRSFAPTTAQIHFDEIDDDEMRRFAESLEQEQQDIRMSGNEQEADLDDEQLCEDYATKMQTPTKSVQIETNKRKERCIEDLDALLNDNDDDDNDDDTNQQRAAERQQQMSPVFKKKP